MLDKNDIDAIKIAYLRNYCLPYTIQFVISIPHNSILLNIYRYTHNTNRIDETYIHNHTLYLKEIENNRAIYKIIKLL